MDPIHPIVSLPPRIPQVAPTPLAGRVDRDGQREGREDAKRRRRPAQPAESPVDERDSDDDSGLHINVTA